MKITYIHHGSFSVEFSGAAVLFDYYAGPLPDFPKERLRWKNLLHLLLP